MRCKVSDDIANKANEPEPEYCDCGSQMTLGIDNKFKCDDESCEIERCEAKECVGSLEVDDDYPKYVCCDRCSFSKLRDDIL
jgi:hypothetical protein